MSLYAGKQVRSRCARSHMTATHTWAHSAYYPPRNARYATGSPLHQTNQMNWYTDIITIIIVIIIMY